MLLNLVPQTGVFWIGGDLGYTNDPTEIVVFQELELGDRRVLKLILRVHMERVAYPHIAQSIALLAREQANLDQIGEETVSLKPVLTDPVFI